MLWDMATAKLASDLSSKRYDDVRVWAGLLAGESRGEAWVNGGYAAPDTVVRIARQLDTLRSGGLICLIGSQGVGKSSALMALYQWRPDTILLKWRRERELHTSFLENTRKTSHAYLYRYSIKLDYELESKLRLSALNPADRLSLEQFSESIVRLEQEGVLYSSCPDIAWAESKMDKSTVQRLRQDTCFEVLLEKEVILIDTPDYSKTDRRRMAKDLESIHWLWNKIASSGGPTIVFAVQKEMSEGHFFLDKANKFELEPLQPERMVQVYVRRFQSTEPFTEKALLKLAEMSRGIFRRFLRYILLSLDRWECKPDSTEVIDEDLLVQAVPVERLAEDMELELFALFPKHSDLRLLAVRLIMLLEERGERRQSELEDLLGVKDYALSRLLAKLETAHYVTRRREGNDKVVSLYAPKTAANTSSNPVVVV
jgi:hypothetical protein